MAELTDRKNVVTGDELTISGETLQFNVAGGTTIIEHKISEIQGFVTVGTIDKPWREKLAPGVLRFTVNGTLSIASVPDTGI